MAFAATPPYDGTLCKYYRLPSDFCYLLPAHVTLEEGALIEPLAVAVHIVGRTEVRPGQSVVVFGAGPVGLLCAAVARAFGAGKIVAVDINGERLAFAGEYLGGAGMFEPRTEGEESEDAARRLKEEQGLGDGADVVIEASGAEASIRTGIEVVRTGGVFVQGGMGKPEVMFPVMTMCTKEMTVRGSFRYGEGDYRLAVGLVAEGKVDVKRLITRKVAFEDAEAAFEEVKQGKGIKVLIGGVTG